MTVQETNWHRLHRIANARRTRMGLTQAGLQELGGPSKAWWSGVRALEGPPSSRHIPMLRRLDAVLRWPEGTSWDLVERDRSNDDSALLVDEERDLIDYKDDISAFMLMVERRIRSLPADELRPAMLAIGRVLGLPVLDE